MMKLMYGNTNLIWRVLIPIMKVLNSTHCTPNKDPLDNSKIDMLDMIHATGKRRQELQRKSGMQPKRQALDLKMMNHSSSGTAKMSFMLLKVQSVFNLKEL